jgi:hypothetical protein
MAYAMVGIPLGLVMFQSIGERLNKFASVLIRRAKRYMQCKRIEATEMNLMLATGMLSSVIITTGAAVFSRYEGWTYFDSFYYCFVTLTTIGFGDYVALQVCWSICPDVNSTLNCFACDFEHLQFKIFHMITKLKENMLS